MPADATPRQDERIRSVSFFQSALSRPELGSVCGLILIVIAFVIMTSSAGTFSAMWTNPTGIQAWVELAAYVGILSVAASMLMISGEFDLSIGANIALAGHTFAIQVLLGVPIPIAVLFTFIALAALGALIGTIVVRTGLPSFIVTLGFWFASRGFAIFMSQTLFQQSRLSIRPFVDPPAGGGEDPTWIDNVFAFDRAFGLPFDAYFYYFIIIAVAATYMLQRTRYGNWIFASGGDPVAARAVGVPVARVKISLFMFSASMACLLGVVTVMSSGSADPQAGDFRELHAIAAAVIGGCALTGGYGSVVGAVFGAFIFAIASRGINFVPFIDNNLFRVMLGLLILGAALLNQALRNRVVKG
ncbi:MAG: ABC transporter permease [Pseudomonadota bacterium]